MHGPSRPSGALDAATRRDDQKAHEAEDVAMERQDIGRGRPADHAAHRNDGTTTGKTIVLASHGVGAGNLPRENFCYIVAYGSRPTQRRE